MQVLNTAKLSVPVQVGFVVCIVASCLCVIFRSEMLTLDRALLALAIVWLGLAPGILYVMRPRALRPAIPLMPMTGLFYAVFFGVPAFFAFSLRGASGPSADVQRIEFYRNTYVETVNIEAQMLVLVGLALMLMAWLAVRKLGKRLKISFPEQAPGSDLDLILAVLLLALCVNFYWLSPAVRSLPSIGQFLQPAGVVAFALFYILWIKGRLSTWIAAFYFLGSLPLWMATLISIGLMTPVIFIVLVWLVLRFHYLGKIPWRIAILGVVAMTIIYPSLSTYRTHYWRSANTEPATFLPADLDRAALKIRLEEIRVKQDILGENDPESIELERQKFWILNELHGGASTSEKLLGFVGILGNRVSNMFRDPMNIDLDHVRLVRRISAILTLSHVVEQTPKNIPFWQGETYRTLFIGWVPRLVWLEKPEERWGYEFGRRYGILLPHQTSMSVNMPWITEMYANFGKVGILIGMFLAGLFLGFLDCIINAPRSKITGVAISGGLLFPLFYHESNFTVMTGSFLPQLVCFWIFFFAVPPMLGWFRGFIRS